MASDAGFTVKGKLAEAMAPFESVTVTVTLEEPAAVGVPEIAPAVDTESPAGRLLPVQL